MYNGREDSALVITVTNRGLPSGKETRMEENDSQPTIQIPEATSKATTCTHSGCLHIPDYHGRIFTPPSGSHHNTHRHLSPTTSERHRRPAGIEHGKREDEQRGQAGAMERARDQVQVVTKDALLLCHTADIPTANMQRPSSYRRAGSVSFVATLFSCRCNCCQHQTAPQLPGPVALGKG